MSSPAACLLCRGALDETPMWTVTDHLGVAAGTFNFHRCSACGSAVLHPVPTREILKAAYPPEYMFRTECKRGLLGALKSLEWALFHRARFRRAGRLIRRLPVDPGATVLDVGCGEGYRAAALNELGFRAEGLEMPSSAAAGTWRRLGLTVHEGLVEDLADDLAERYDVVTMYSVFEHLPDPAGTLAAVRRMLKPSGWLLIQVPLADGLTTQLLGKRHIFAREAPRHVCLPSRRGLRHILAETGFETVSAAPAFLAARAGVIGISLVTGTDYQSAIRRSSPVYLLKRAAAAAATLVAGVPLSLLEQAVDRYGMTVLTARAKP